MCMLKLNKTIVSRLLIEDCLWENKIRKGITRWYLVAWEMVCKPKDKGRLGVINLEIQNDAMIMKQLLKFFNHSDSRGYK
jgi:hypothetical protein